jgi:hypothetical protein
MLLVEAALWLGIARAAILTIPFRWTIRLFALNPGAPIARARPLSTALADRICRALRAAAARTPWESACLAQALAASGMMRLRRIPATMVLGVRKSADGTEGIDAHAWLHCGEVILTGAPGHERYRIIARFSLAARP